MRNSLPTAFSLAAAALAALTLLSCALVKQPHQSAAPPADTLTLPTAPPADTLTLPSVAAPPIEEAHPSIGQEEEDSDVMRPSALKRRAKELRAEAARLRGFAQSMMKMSDMSKVFDMMDKKHSGDLLGKADEPRGFNPIERSDSEPLAREIRSLLERAMNMEAEADALLEQEAKDDALLKAAKAGQHLFGGDNSFVHTPDLHDLFTENLVPNHATGGRHALEADLSAARARSSSNSSFTASRLAVETGKIDDLVTGNAGVSAPDRATVGEPFVAFLRVSPEGLEAVLQGLRQESPENKNVIGKGAIKLTPRMVASVTGIGFEISPKESVVQAVSPTEPTTWQWEIRPTESGHRTLIFKLSGALLIEGKDVSRDFYSYRQEVNVDVTAASFLKEYWQWFVTTLIIPVAGGLWALFRKPKSADGVARQSFAAKLRARYGRH